MTDKVIALITAAACFICAFGGYKYASLQAEYEYYKDLSDAKQQVIQALDERTKIEKQWREQVAQLRFSAAADRRQIEARYFGFLKSLSDTASNAVSAGADERVHKSNDTASSNSVPGIASTAGGTGAVQTDRQPGQGCRVYQDALTKAKKRILYEAKERDICSVHYNTLLQIYQSVSDNKVR